MIFGIDFDGTFAADPDLFRGFVAALRARGHEAVLVTGRSDEPPWGDQVRALVGDLLPIVFAADHWKRDAAERAGFKVDVWLDDHPEYVAAQDPRKIARRVAEAAGRVLRVLCFGARTWKNERIIGNWLQKLPPGAIVGHGGANGADKRAGAIARALGHEVREFLADWAAHGTAAGPLRNRRQQAEFMPHVALGFTDALTRGPRCSACGRERLTGSGDMASVALAAGTRVTLIPSKSDGIP